MRTMNEIRREAIEILSREEYTITQFMQQINRNHINSKKLLQDLIDEGLVTTIEKRSSVKNMMCVHYHAPSPCSLLKENQNSLSTAELKK